MALDFALGKLGCNLIYNTYLNGSFYDYYISILGGVGFLWPYLFCLSKGGWGGHKLESMLI